MSKNLDRYWQIEYQLQNLWGVPDKDRNYKLISRLTAEQSSIKDSLIEEEREQLIDIALTNHWQKIDKTICHTKHAQG